MITGPEPFEDNCLRKIQLISYWTKRLTKEGYGHSKTFKLARKYALRDIRKENKITNDKLTSRHSNRDHQ